MGNETFCFIGLGATGIRLVQALPVDFLRDKRLHLATHHSSLAEHPHANALLLGAKFLHGAGSPSIAQTIKAINMAEKELLAQVQSHQHVVILADLASDTGAAAPYLAELLLKHGFTVSLGLLAPFERDKERDQRWQQRVNGLRAQLNYCEVFDSPYQESKKGRQTLVHRLLKDVALRVMTLVLSDEVPGQL